MLQADRFKISNHHVMNIFVVEVEQAVIAIKMMVADMGMMICEWFGSDCLKSYVDM